MRQLLQLLLLTCSIFPLYALNVTLNQNDPYQLHNSKYTLNFLSEHHREVEKGDSAHFCDERMRLSITPFAQKAQMATNRTSTMITDAGTTSIIPGTITPGDVNAGDVWGRWNFLGLLYGTIPQRQTQPAILQNAAAQAYQDGQLLNYANYTDVKKELGFLSIPLRYRKLGIRFDYSVRLFSDLIVSMETGFASIKQMSSGPLNVGRIAITASATPGTNLIKPSSDVYGNGAFATLVPDQNTVETALIDPYLDVLAALGLDASAYNELAAEDTFVSCMWKHHFYANEELDEKDWPHFILTPFFKITGTIPTGKIKTQHKLFSLPSGNNGHVGVSMTTGFTLDFFDSIEIGWQAGAAHFFRQNIKGVYLPTHEYQSGIFPYKTDVSSKPGKTWFFSGGFNAYHFNDKLSCSLEYIFVNHQQDLITLLTPDAAFKPEKYAELTAWKVQSLAVGFNYDLSPHLCAGLSWQIPLDQVAAYKTSTLSCSIIGTF